MGEGSIFRLRRPRANGGLRRPPDRLAGGRCESRPALSLNAWLAHCRQNSPARSSSPARARTSSKRANPFDTRWPARGTSEIRSSSLARPSQLSGSLATTLAEIEGQARGSQDSLESIKRSTCCCGHWSSLQVSRPSRRSASRALRLHNQQQSSVGPANGRPADRSGATSEPTSERRQEAHTARMIVRASQASTHAYCVSQDLYQLPRGLTSAECAAQSARPALPTPLGGHPNRLIWAQSQVSPRIAGRTDLFGLAHKSEKVYMVAPSASSAKPTASRGKISHRQTCNSRVAAGRRTGTTAVDFMAARTTRSNSSAPTT